MESDSQSIGPRHRRVLKMLARARQHGCDVNALFSRGFEFELIADLARTELAAVQLESMRKRGRTVEVARVRITDAGRRLLEGLAEWE
jgi:hypothetical protein